MNRIGFIGLGRMGKSMASNLQRKGFQLTVFDIAKPAMDELQALGAKPASGVAELIAASDIVLTVLPGSSQVEEVVFGPEGLTTHGRPGMLFMDLSTIDPNVTDRCAAALAGKDIGMVDSPIGRLAFHADRGECLFMVGGSAANVARVRALLEAMGTTIYHCGDVGTGIRTKLVNNYLAVALNMMNAEALTLAEAYGLDLATTLNVIHGTAATNGQLKINYATKVLAGDVSPGFTVDLAHKDISLIVNSANAHRVSLPLGAATREAMSLARATPFHASDFSAMLDFWCERAGVGQVRLPAAAP